MTTLQIDIETYSSADLPSCGVHRYVEASDFEILLFAYAYDAEPVQLVDFTAFEELPDKVLSDLTNADVIKTAFNAAFERTCIAKHFAIECHPSQWRCTMVHAMALGLPGYLAGAAEVLKLDAQKDSRGKALIKYFSVPCKPTKTNGERTRNYPHHDPEKWEMYKSYNVQDVVVEREIRRKLDRFPVPAHEWHLWSIDQQINDRGARLDSKLVHMAIACDALYEARLMREAQQLTGLDNPNSLTQLKGWLADRGLETSDGLSKNQMPVLLDAAPDGETRRVLELRQEMSKTSVDKYNAMQRSMCADSRARGLLQFCGAGRTWRWAGRLIQVQNLPQNKIEDLALAREILRSGDFELLEMFFGAPPFVLSQLIRTAFIPSENCRFIVSDFSAIESRVISWLADEQWKLDVFQGHGRIYESTASRMFGIPMELIKKGNPEYALRQKGKVAELACIAEGQLVLTDRGLVPIERVTSHHRVWDGIEWVTHGGIISRGVKEVITYDGLTATADHVVWIEGQSGPVRFGDAVARNARLVRSGAGRHPLRRFDYYKSRKEISRERNALEFPESVGSVREVRNDPVAIFLQPSHRISMRLFKHYIAPFVQKISECESTLYKPEPQEFQELWSPRNTIPIQKCARRLRVGLREPRHPGRSDPADRSYRQQWPLRTGESQMGVALREPTEKEEYDATILEPRRVAVCAFSGIQEISAGNDQTANHRGSPTGSSGQTDELASNCREARVFDILNAGPRNRFTVSGKLVHNCGYQGGPNALAVMDSKKEIDADEYPGLVKQWRKANPNIVKLWYAAEDAAVTAVREKTTVKLAHGVKYRYEAGVLFADLPSGRSLAYVNPRIKADPNFDKDGLVFDGMDQVKKKWMSHRTYGGRLVENLVQAIARDCLGVTLRRLDDEGYKIVMHVHDEVVLDVPLGTGSVEHVSAVMGMPIDWAPGLPLTSAGFEAPFYMKD